MAEGVGEEDAVTEEQLQEIRQRCNGATPAPWVAHCRDVSGLFTRDDSFLGFEVHGPPDAIRGQFERGADALFIAHAREDVPALLSEVDRLRRLLRQAYEVVVWQARTDVELRPLAEAIRAVGVGE